MVVRRSWTPLHSIRVLLYSTVPPGVNSTPIPINLGSSTDIVVLELFGTGVRGVNSYIGGGSPFATLGNVVSVGNGWTVLYAGPQGAGASGSFYGMDQINVVLPHSLAGSGMTSVNVSVVSYCAGCGVSTGFPWELLSANTLQIYIQ